MRPEQLCPGRLKGDKGTGITERGINPEDTVRESWRGADREAGSILEEVLGLSSNCSEVSIHRFNTSRDKLGKSTNRNTQASRTGEPQNFSGGRYGCHPWEWKGPRGPVQPQVQLFGHSKRSANPVSTAHALRCPSGINTQRHPESCTRRPRVPHSCPRWATCHCLNPLRGRKDRRTRVAMYLRRGWFWSRFWAQVRAASGSWRGLKHTRE